MLFAFLLGCEQRAEQTTPATTQQIPATHEQTGPLVLNSRLEHPGQFSDGLAAVRIGDGTTGKWGFIDKHGTMVISPQ
ncbi:MAG: WG repeat-containing protein, partial [Nitrospira sp.]|nr:WG repeat-containing protein [Nitrospira sp.]